MSLTTRTDVTAVKLFKNLILAGIGSYVNVYDRETTKLLHRMHSLDGQKIHGLVPFRDSKRVLVFGGKQITVLGLECSKEVSVSRLFDPVLCDDWIHCAIWIDSDVVAVLTAHNVVQKWKTSDQSMLTQYVSKENSILYSGLLLPVEEELIVFAGTVYSEVIILKCGGEVLHRLEGHRGVIFSICCDSQKAIIVTTSDDRSVRIWTIKNLDNHSPSTIDFWVNMQVQCSHEVYGHAARVMRSCITKDYIVSGGEDASICFWSLDGSLIRKAVSHQTSTIWSIDYDNDFLITGGGDGGIALHPLTIVSDYYQKEVLDVEGTVRKIQFTARNNIVMVNDQDELIYYDVKSKLKMPHKLGFQSTYRMMSLSPCRQLVCAADMNGNVNVYVENCKDATYLKPLIDTQVDVDRLMSVHWAGNRHLVLCSHEGIITVLAANSSEAKIYCKFRLPQCRERYLTAATIVPNNDMIIVGDRCGNIHCFMKGQQLPVKTFKRAHGSYGPTSITYRNNEIVSTGRVGTISYHSINDDNVSTSKYLTDRHLDFQWVEKFLDKDENLVCGFHDKNFVVYNLKMNAMIYEVYCWGGHRPWDANRYFEQVNNKYEEFIRLTFVKNSFVYLYTSQLSKIVSKPIVNGSQSKIIHCLKSYKTDLDSSKSYLISGGEDTTLRVSRMNSDFEFQDEFVYKHLSNIRAVKIFPSKDNQLLVFSTGGRAQLCINLFKFEMCAGVIKVSCQELADFMVKGDDEKRKSQKLCREHEFDSDPETRMMDVDAIQLSEHQFLIILGCSDTILRAYFFDKNTKDFRHMQDIDYHKRCILKTVYIKFYEIDIVVTGTTRGEIRFWRIYYKDLTFKMELFGSIDLDNSGTNSLDYRIVDKKLVIAIGGDNNAISMLLIAIGSDSENKELSIDLLDSKKMDHFHCSQVTGLVLLEDAMICCSIDQRVTVCRWQVVDSEIRYNYLRQVYTDISDVAGLELMEHSRESATVCVHGKGFEVLKLDLTDQS